MTQNSIWKEEVDLPRVNEIAKGSMLDYLGIEFTEVGPDFLRASMPVDHRTKQPFGILHGGASVVLAESIGSMAANLCIGLKNKAAVGLDISANHIRQVVEGRVIGTARPLHIGGRTQVWEIRIENERGQLVCVSRLTILVVNRLASGAAQQAG